MFGLLSDLTRLALAPVKIAVDIVEPAVRVVTEPLAEVADEVVEAVREITR